MPPCPCRSFSTSIEIVFSSAAKLFAVAATVFHFHYGTEDYEGGFRMFSQVLMKLLIGFPRNSII